MEKERELNMEKEKEFKEWFNGFVRIHSNKDHKTGKEIFVRRFSDNNVMAQQMLIIRINYESMIGYEPTWDTMQSWLYDITLKRKLELQEYISSVHDHQFTVNEEDCSDDFEFDEMVLFRDNINTIVEDMLFVEAYKKRRERYRK